MRRLYAPQEAHKVQAHAQATREIAYSAFFDTSLMQAIYSWYGVSHATLTSRVTRTERPRVQTTQNILERHAGLYFQHNAIGRRFYVVPYCFQKSKAALLLIPQTREKCSAELHG